ncbi:MAG: lipid-A-disaccharide synthase [candidate division Zixibacteria bacterium]|nr:lipid-A-disaccharide synthase [candidate division Zixibacteria bacterium]
MSAPSFFLSAGDPSGDNAAARLADQLRKKVPELSLFGLGGSRLRTLGQEQLADPGDLAVLGFWEVARHFRFFQKLLRRCADEIRSRRPNCLILVDYPGFNLRLAKMVRPLGIPIVYYISPQVWAWGHRRLRLIRECVDLMLSILPFEQQFYKDSGVESCFVGHYLLEDIPADLIASEPPTDGGLALLPGSRRQEIERMLPAMLETASRFSMKFGTRAVVAGVRGSSDYESLIRKHLADGVTVVYDDARQVIHDSSLVLTASGTATLETAVIGRPMVVLYKTGFVTYQIAKHLIKIDKIALVNLVLNDKVVPELIQGEATPDKMLAELEKLYNDESHYGAIRARLNEVPSLLGGTGASERAAQMILQTVEGLGAL